MNTLFYRNTRYFILAVALIVSAGLSSVLTIGRQEDPTITNLFATIVTPYPGATPARVEALVTEKVEEELREIEEIDEISSVSRTGVSVISVSLSEYIDDAAIERTWSEIRDALSAAEINFPNGAGKSDFDNDRTGAYTTLSAITAADGLEVSPGILKRYAERLQERMRAVPGTELVRLFGEQEEEVLVAVDPDRLVALGLTVNAVARTIAAADTKVEAGRVRGAQSDFLIEVGGEIDSLDRIRAVPLVTSESGQIIRVGDLAQVTRSQQTPPSAIAFADGEPAVIVASKMQPDLQVDAWAGAAEQAMAAFENDLPGGVKHTLLFNQARYTADRLTGLGVNILIGISLVVAVMLVTLGWRAALIVAAVLPLTTLLSVAVLQRMGIPIHQMSVTGLIVALGLLVDAAIVMTDEIRRRIIAGLTRVEAVGQSVNRLAMPLLASTVTTVLAFLPMAILPGPAGDFVGSIAISVIVMLIASFLLAMSLTPALAGFILPDHEPDQPAWWGHGADARPIQEVFKRSLDWSLRNRALAIMAALTLPVMGFMAFPTLTAQFFPGVDRDQFYVQVSLPDGAALEETTAVAERADAILRADEGVMHAHWFIGESAPAFYYNMIQDQDGVASFAEALVTTRSDQATQGLVPQLQATFDVQLPEAQFLVRDLVQGPPVSAPVEVRLVGPELETLRLLGEDLRQRIAGHPAVTHTKASLMGGAPKFVFDLSEDKVRQTGQTLGDVAAQLQSSIEGATGGSLLEGSEELPVRVRIIDENRATASRIKDLNVVVAPPQGGGVRSDWLGVPLSALGDSRVVPSDSSIARLDGERVNTVQAFLQIGVLPEEVLKDVRTGLLTDPMALPQGYRIEYGGDSDARADVVSNLVAPMGLIIALLIATIVLTFDSFRLTFVALGVAVLSMGLSVLALAIFRYPFGIQAVIGVIGSIGVSINAAIIIMTALQKNAQAMANDPVAIRDVVMASGRHIVSTTITTFGGFLPLILAGGDFWPPFAMAIAGGVLLSTVVSFYFVPPMFSVMTGGRALTVRKQSDEWTHTPAATGTVVPGTAAS